MCRLEGTPPSIFKYSCHSQSYLIVKSQATSGNVTWYAIAEIHPWQTLVIRPSEMVSNSSHVNKFNSIEPLNKQCYSLAYQVFSILAFACPCCPCCSHRNHEGSGCGSRNWQFAIHNLQESNFCRNRRGVPLVSEFGYKSHLGHFNCLMAIVYYLL